MRLSPAVRRLVRKVVIFCGNTITSDCSTSQLLSVRGQEPSDVGEAVAFLPSGRGRNITGQLLNVCGGQQMMD